jgi:hypothetical protein
LVQVFCYHNGKRVIVKHIGSGTTDNEIASLDRRLVVMAYAAMISTTNVTALKAENIN